MIYVHYTIQIDHSYIYMYFYVYKKVNQILS